MTNEEKKELFEAWKGGDKTAYNKLYKGMYATVLDAVKANLEEGKQDSAENIAQDVMVKVFKSVDTLEDTSNSDEWLKSIVTDYLGDKKDIPNEVIADAVTPEKVENAEAESEKTDEEPAKEENKTEDVKAKPVVNESNEEKKKEESAPKADPVVNASEKKLSAPKNKKTVFGVIAAAVVVVIIAIFAVLNSTPTIDINKYATVTFDGYDGYGSASVDVDWDKIKQDYGDKIKYTDEVKKQAKSLLGDEYGDAALNSGLFDTTDILQMYVEDDLDTNDKNGELKNNDKVSLKWDVDDSYSDSLKVKIKAPDKEFTVKGLEKAKVVDVFKNVKVEFSGINGQGTASVSSSNDAYDMITSSDLDKTEQLSNGDEITLTLSNDDISEIASNGTVPKEKSKIYKVSGLTKYAEKVSDISDDTWDAIKTQAEDILREEFVDDDYYYYSYGTPEYVGNFVLVNKDQDRTTGWSWYSHDYVGTLYKVVLTGTYEGSSYSNNTNVGATETVYFNVYFRNITVDDKGKTDDSLVENGSIESVSHQSDVMHTYVYGYTSIDDAYSGIVDANAANYTADWNVKE